eukprot:863406-Pyramimonas_sp.AAC.1
MSVKKGIARSRARKTRRKKRRKRNADEDDDQSKPNMHQRCCNTPSLSHKSALHTSLHSLISTATAAP